MRIKISETWKTRVDIALPGAGADEVIEAHFTAEFKELSLSAMKAAEKDRRTKVREASRLRREPEPDLAQIEAIEDELAQSDRRLLDRVLIAVHGIELEKPDGSVMSQAELLDYVKDHADFLVPLVQAFAGRVQRVVEKNSEGSGKR